MNIEQIHRLIDKGHQGTACQKAQLIETHISWVILCDEFVYKIKKPIHYSFLDFSNLNKRKFYCEKEIELNKRLAGDVYRDLVYVVEEADNLFLKDVLNKEDKICDYAVRMKRMPSNARMDKLLLKGLVDEDVVSKIADQLIPFHKEAQVHKESRFLLQKTKFNDLAHMAWKCNVLGLHVTDLISDAVDQSNEFLESHMELFIKREEDGFVRDGHGDLHSRNIFLLPEPVIFDCIEFNDDFRIEDVLNELAFFCMDLDMHGYPALSKYFFSYYNSHFEVCRNEDEHLLFNYYKAYRANVRAKVNVLRAQSAMTALEETDAINKASRYLQLMQGYLEKVMVNSTC